MKKFWKTDKEELKQEIIEQIFQRDINAVDDNGYTLLLRVAASGFHTLLSLLFTVKTLDVNLTDKDGRTALMLACKNGHVETVRRLLCDPRIDVNLEFRSEEMYDNDNPLTLDFYPEDSDVYYKTALSYACNLCEKPDTGKKIINLLLAHPQLEINADAVSEAFSQAEIGETGSDLFFLQILSMPHYKTYNALFQTTDAIFHFAHTSDSYIYFLTAILHKNYISVSGWGEIKNFVETHGWYGAFFNSDFSPSQQGPDFYLRLNENINFCRENAKLIQEIVLNSPAGFLAMILLVQSERLEKSDKSEKPAKDFYRFLDIALKLPMELQMRLCNKTEDSDMHFIPSNKIISAMEILLPPSNLHTLGY